jgi:hypothetical protein
MSSSLWVTKRAIATSDNKDWRAQFERTILDTLKKNLHQLTLRARSYTGKPFK